MESEVPCPLVVLPLIPPGRLWRGHHLGGKTERTMQISLFLTCGGSCPTGADSKVLPDAQHVVPGDVTSHEIDSLFDECWAASCSQHPGLDMARGAPIQTVCGQAAYHWSSHAQI